MSNPSLSIAKLPPILQAGLIHVAAWAIVVALAIGLRQLGLTFDQGWLFISQGLAAGALSYLLSTPVWWVFINLLFFPAVDLMLRWEFSPLWYLGGLALLLVTQFGAVRSRVPLYLSGNSAKTELLRQLPQTPGLRLLDIGSGTGGMLAFLAKQRPDLALHGIESAPLPYLLGKLRLGSHADIRLGNFWNVDLSTYDAVYAFLSPAPMAKLWDKAKREMRPGSLFVSNTFEVPGVVPDASIELNDLHHGRLLLWRMS